MSCLEPGKCRHLCVFLLVLGLIATGGASAQTRETFDQIGGDDEGVFYGEENEKISFDFADDGTIFAAIERYDEATGWEILVARSIDGGQLFGTWGTLEDPDPANGFQDPYIEVVEGVVDKLFVAYHGSGSLGNRIGLVSTPLTGYSASWSAETIALQQTGVYFWNPRFDTDVSSFENFRIYLVASGDDVTGEDIWFARSTDQGTSFETPYMLASLAVDDRRYLRPDIAYGFGGHLHVTWYFASGDGSFDDSIRYRRASNYANGGVADWDNWVTMTSTSNDIDDNYPRIEAGKLSDEVVLVYQRRSLTTGQLGVGFFISYDSGSTWPDELGYTDGPTWLGDLKEQPDTNMWMLLGLRYKNPHLYTAHASALTSWTDLGTFEDEDYPVWDSIAPCLALNPAKDDRPAVLWNTTGSGAGQPTSTWFDADWRNDPGFPNHEPGWPLSIVPGPISDPALVDLDQDGDLEIVFTSGLSNIQALNHDGSSPPGWPVTVPATLGDAPVAVGDLNGDGIPIVVVGTADGEAYAYDHLGNLLPGWPTTITGAGNTVYVSIGALGPPYHRCVVCVAGNLLHYRNRSGNMPPGAVPWSFGGTYDFIAPAAIGDIDDDGTAEVVGARHTAVFAAEMLSGSLDFIVSTGDPVSDAPTLGDIDRDGDLEILVPTDQGVLHVLDHTGASIGGNFPYDTGVVEPLTSAVLAQIRGTMDLEIVFGTEYNGVHALYADGTVLSGFPVAASGYDHIVAPAAIGIINGGSGDVVAGARNHIAWAWDNYGNTIEGWPIGAGLHSFSPAIGDIDLDGANEIVFISDVEYDMVDVNSSGGSASNIWAMYGHDPQRTGCSDCPESMVVGVDPGTDGNAITRVSFAAPSPNPMTGSTQFSYAIPRRAAVSLEIFDLRGARVATILREETGPGRNVISWHGLDDGGRPVASGQYFARLRVRGPGVNEELTRKITFLQ